jgi:hypothetical protein
MTYPLYIFHNIRRPGLTPGQQLCDPGFSDARYECQLWDQEAIYDRGLKNAPGPRPVPPLGGYGCNGSTCSYPQAQQHLALLALSSL